MKNQVNISYLVAIFLRANVLMWFQTSKHCILSHNFKSKHHAKSLKNTANKSIWPIDEILTLSTTTQSQNGSNGNKGASLHSPELQNSSLSNQCSLMSYQEQTFGEVGSYPSAEDAVGAL